MMAMYTEEQQHQLNKLTKQLIKNPNHKPTQKRIELLSQVIDYHNWRYYTLSQPVIQDVDYNWLGKELNLMLSSTK